MLKFSLIFATLLALSCAKKPEEASASLERALYVASGTCLSGTGNTVPAASNIIYKVNLSTGAPGEIVVDYANSMSTLGDTPTNIVNLDDNAFMVLVENAASPGLRRLEKISKSSGHARTYFYNMGGLSPQGTARGLAYNPDGTFLFGRTAQIEKLQSSGARASLPPPASATAPWILGTSLTGSCANSPVAAYSFTSIQSTNSGKIIFTNYTSAQGRVAVASSTGFVTAADCLSGVNSAVATAYPTASVYLPTYNKVLVLFAGNNAAANNYISVYDFDESTGALTNEAIAYQNTAVIYGGSAMTLDSNTGKIYVATANNTATTISNYNIEEFTFDPSNRTLTRVGIVPFSAGWLGSKCISSMFIGN